MLKSKLVKNTTISLNSGEQAVCELIAKRRFDNNRNDNIKNSKIGDQSNEFTDLEGIGGEVAFCKLVNAFPDFSCENRTTAEDLGDLILNNYRIDVKTTKYKNGRLVVVPWKKCTVDLYVLMIGEFPTYTYKGAFWSKNVIVPSRLGNLGHGPTYIVEQNELL